MIHYYRNQGAQSLISTTAQQLPIGLTGHVLARIGAMNFAYQTELAEDPEHGKLSRNVFEGYTMKNNTRG